MGALAPAVQRGGTSDLDPLWDELTNWPGYYVSELRPSGSWGTHDYDDRPGSSGFVRYDPSSWCIEVMQEGREGSQDRWFEWGSDIREASRKLAETMAKVRVDPHYEHLGLARGPHYFLRGCPKCEQEAADIFGGDVDWTDPE